MNEMAFCSRCEREFSTMRGLEIHFSRSHPVSDSSITDLLNLLPSRQQHVLNATFPGRPPSMENLLELMVDADDATIARLKSALSIQTGVEYRYVIREEP